MFQKKKRKIRVYRLPSSTGISIQYFSQGKLYAPYEKAEYKKWRPIIYLEIDVFLYDWRKYTKEKFYNIYGYNGNYIEDWYLGPVKFTRIRSFWGDYNRKLQKKLDKSV